MTAIAKQPEVVKTAEDFILINPNRLPLFNDKRVVAIMTHFEKLNVESALDEQTTTLTFTDGTRQKVLISDLCKNIRRLLGWQVVDGLNVFVNSLTFTVNQGTSNSQKPLMSIFCNPTSLPQSMDSIPFFLVFPKNSYKCGITTPKDPYFKKVFEQN